MEDKPTAATFSSFWKEKFNTEDLPLLEEGTDFTHWVTIYERSLEAAEIAHERIDSGQKIEISIARVSDLYMLRVTDLDQGTWNMIQSNITDGYLDWLIIEADTIIHDYYLVLSPRAGFYLYEKVDKQEELDEEGILHRTVLLPSSKIALTKDDAWFFVYRLAYFGYRF